MDNFEVKIVEETRKKFRSEMVMTIEQIAESLIKSIPTARYRLKQWDAITSYDRNGRYYTLPDIPRFDSYGLWSYKNIHFSKYGNLKNTLINIVENSPSGLDGTNIGKLLGLDPRSFLSHFGKLSGLRREKISGRFIYFSSEEVRLKKQLNERVKSFSKKVDSPLPDSVGVVILVEKIKHPKISLEKLTKCLQNKGLSVTRKKIQDFFLYHGLQKKTLDSFS
jgi:hypothetical protein